MKAARVNRLFFLSVNLFLLCFGLMACSGGKTAEDYVKQGKEFLTAKQYDQAIASFSKAIELDPKMTVAYNNRGIVYCNKGDFAQAVSDFNRVIDLDPAHGKAYNNRAVAYLMKGDKDKARQDVEKAKSLGVPVNQMLIDSLSQEEAKGPEKVKVEAVPAQGPTKSQAEAQGKAPDKPEAKGQGEAKKK